jgi:hypothetical protein
MLPLLPFTILKGNIKGNSLFRLHLTSVTLVTLLFYI